MTPETKLSFAFDIGHSSIGWAVIRETQGVVEPSIAGCGTVIFKPQDCQNQQRAAFRRQRRHIAATRNRIKRMRNLLAKMGVLGEEELRRSSEAGGGHSFPWLLATQVLSCGTLLNWHELWNVLRWYAHNRGYDGNMLWSNDQNSDKDEDTEKLHNAKALMEKHGTGTMAETICAFLGIDPKAKENPPPTAYFKGQNTAFPRETVVAEVNRILAAHNGKLHGVDKQFIRAMLSDWKVARDHFGAKIRLPKRYFGGLLFGQMIPRFDNRIIPECRISSEKTPDKHCREYYRFRWGVLMANLRKKDYLSGYPVPLTAPERQKLHAIMEENGYLTKSSLQRAMVAHLGVEPANIDQMFLTAEMEDALVLDPVKKELGTNRLKDIWPLVPDKFRKIFAGELFKQTKPKAKQRTLRSWLTRMREQGVDTSAIEQVIARQLEQATKKFKGKGQPPTIDSILDAAITIQARATGRSPYSRALMAKAWEEVMAGLDPKARREDGTFGSLAETESVIAMALEKDIDKQTNNHLVRHRLLIYRKLLAELTSRYASNNPQAIEKVVIEVVRDLQEFSGKTAKEKAQLLGIKLSDHKRTVEWLEEQRPQTGISFQIGAGLIKKVRIARDMDWTCPFTGKPYRLPDILAGNVDREHIIPKSLRNSDSLESLVLTFSEINRMKGQRTGMQFIEETKDNSVTLSPAQYEELVKKLKVSGGSDDDVRRRMKRKQLLLLPKYNEREGEFTGRDLSQTSHLTKLAARQTLGYLSSLGKDRRAEVFQAHQIVHLAGSVTGCVRKSWRLNGCLALANPRICDESGNPKPKGDIRDITHLHHALDAVTLGLAAHYLPNSGTLWRLLGKRRLNDTERREIRQFCRLGVSCATDGSFDIEDIPTSLKNEVAKELAKNRVVAHLPKTMRGLRTQQNIWRIKGKNAEDPLKLDLTQAMRDAKTQKRVRKFQSEKASKVLGNSPANGNGKLKKLKGGLIVEDNYGLALDPEPAVIPHLKVFQRVSELKAKNGGNLPRILRNGQIIEIKSGNYAGFWRVHSLKDSAKGFKVDMGKPDIPRPLDGTEVFKREVNLSTLIKNGLTIISSGYTGAAP